MFKERPSIAGSRRGLECNRSRLGGHLEGLGVVDAGRGMANGVAEMMLPSEASRWALRTEGS